MVNQKKIGVILSYAAQFVHILTSLIYVPIMLRVLGQNEYGLYQLSTATISNLNILTLGFNSAYIRFYSRYKSNDDKTGIAKLNGMFMTIFSILAIICIACGMVLVLNARFVLGNNLSETEIKVSQILMALLVISMSITFINSVFQSQVTAYEKFLWLKAIDLVGYIISPCISLPLLLMGYRSISVVCVTLFVSILSCAANLYYTLVRLKIEYSFRCFDFKLFKEMFHFTFYVFINIIVEQINWSIDKYLLGRLSGTESVAVYSVGAQIVSLYRSISGTIRGVFVPQVNRMVAESQPVNKINALFIKLGRIIYLVAFLILSGFLVFGQEFILIWAGEGYGKSYWCAIITMGMLIIPIVQGPGIDIQRAMNLHKARSIAYAFIAFGNLVLSIVLIKNYGEVGAATGTAVALILGQGLFMNIYYHIKIKLDMKLFWKSLCRMLPASSVVVLLGFALKRLIYIVNLQTLIVDIFIYTFIYILIMYLLCMDEFEKNLIKTTINRFRRI